MTQGRKCEGWRQRGVVAIDVSQRAELDEMAGVAMKTFGRIDIVVNTAGFTHRDGDLLGASEQTIDLIYAINMNAVYHASTASLRSAPAPRPVRRVQRLGARRHQVDGRCI